MKPDYDLSKYTVQRIVDETRATNVLLQSLDGKIKRTFAFTCGDRKIGDSSFMDGMKKDFVAARGVRSQMNHIDEVDIYNVDAYGINGETGAQMIEWRKRQWKQILYLLYSFMA
ncbi:MAG: hypothetical protein WDO71_00670 [Bacteroidota bacterium]